MFTWTNQKKCVSLCRLFKSYKNITPNTQNCLYESQIWHLVTNLKMVFMICIPLIYSTKINLTEKG